MGEKMLNVCYVASKMFAEVYCTTNGKVKSS
jgi:hypothetical protein